MQVVHNELIMKTEIVCVFSDRFIKLLSKKFAETFAHTNSFGALGHVSTFCSKLSGDKGVRVSDFFQNEL